MAKGATPARGTSCARCLQAAIRHDRRNRRVGVPRRRQPSEPVASPRCGRCWPRRNDRSVRLRLVVHVVQVLTPPDSGAPSTSRAIRPAAARRGADPIRTLTVRRRPPPAGQIDTVEEQPLMPGQTGARRTSFRSSPSKPARYRRAHRHSTPQERPSGLPGPNGRPARTYSPSPLACRVQRHARRGVRRHQPRRRPGVADRSGVGGHRRGGAGEARLRSCRRSCSPAARTSTRRRRSYVAVSITRGRCGPGVGREGRADLR